MNDAKTILDRIRNLISDDSEVLENYNQKIKAAQDSKIKAENEKEQNYYGNCFAGALHSNHRLR